MSSKGICELKTPAGQEVLANAIKNVKIKLSRVKDNLLETFIDSLKTELKDSYLNKTTDTSANSITELAEAILNHKALQSFKAIPKGRFLNEVTVSSLAEALNPNVPQNEAKKEDLPTKEALLDDPLEEVEKSISVNFVTKAYGTALGALGIMETKMKELFLHAMVYAEDISGKGVFADDMDVANQSLIHSQEELFQTILRYIESQPLVRTDPEARRILERFKREGMYEYDQNDRYKAIRYKGSLEKLLQVKLFKSIMQSITPNITIDTGNSNVITVDKLNSLSANYKINKLSKLKLDTYNAYFLLTHFDDTLHKLYPLLTIRRSKWNSFEIDGYANKYSFEDMGNVVEGWQSLEKDIPIEKHLDDLTKSLIADLNLYEWRSTRKMDSKVTIKDFTRLISKLKKLAYTKLGFMPITSSMTDTKELYLVVKALYGEQIFENGPVTLFAIIGLLNSNAAVNYGKFFAMLSTDAFWKTFARNANGDGFNLNNLDLDRSDRDLIWSIYLGMFKNNNAVELIKLIGADPINLFEGIKIAEPSLYERWKNNPSPNASKNYFDYILETCVGIEAFSLQQYRELDGQIINQSLTDSMRDGKVNMLNMILSSSFSAGLTTPEEFKKLYSEPYHIKNRSLNPNKESAYTDYNFVVSSDSITAKDWDKDDKESTSFIITPRLFQFTAGGFNITVDLRNDKNLEIRDKDGNLYGNSSDKKKTLRAFKKEDLKALLPFLSTFIKPLKIDFSKEKIEDQEILNNYIYLQGGDISLATEDLIYLAANIFAKASVILQIKADLGLDYSLKQFKLELINYLPKTRSYLKLSIQGGGFKNLVDFSKGLPITKVLAEAISIVEGTHSDNTVQDSLRKSLTLIGLTMLATKVEQQIQTLNKKEGSASKHFSLFDGMYRGIEFTREFYGTDNSVEGTKFNVNEHFVSLFLYDFIQGYSKDSRIKIMPSVLSDKPRILKVLIDLNELNKIIPKSYKEFTASDWKKLASIELGTYYTSIFEYIDETFNKLNNFIKTNSKYNVGISDYLPIFDIKTNLQDLNNYIKILFNNKPGNDKRKIKEFAGDFIHDLIYDYNTANPNEPLELTDQIMLIWDKSSDGYIINELLISELSRFAENGNLTIRKDTLVNFKSKEFLGFVDYVNAQLRKLNKLKANQNIAFGAEIPSRYLTNDEFKTLAANYASLNPKFDINKYYKEIIGRDGKPKLMQNNNPIYTKSLQSVVGEYWMDKIKNGDYVTSKSFWENRQSNLVKDILVNNNKIRIFDENYNDVNSSVINALKKGALQGESTESWVSYGDSGLVSFARIGWSEEYKEKVNGEVVTKTRMKYRMISQASDCRGMKYYKPVLDSDGNPMFELDGTPILTEIKFSDPRFNFYEFVQYSDKYETFELNPCLETWNAADFLIGLEFMNSTVGTHLNHPAKKKLHFEDLINEAERFIALTKRNVSISATKHPFTTNLLDGIRDTYKVAVVEDSVATAFNIYGTFAEDGVKPFDGATFVCGPNNYHENKSLGGSFAGSTKKQFIHSYKPETGSGIIIKTAGFPVTNARIRNSIFYADLNKKMMEGKWTKRDGSAFHPDLSKNYFGQDIIWEDGNNGTFYYDENDGNYYQLLSITLPKKNSSTYVISRKKVDIHGLDLDNSIDRFEMTIESNYDLWRAFGGETSMSLVKPEDGSQPILKDSESSFKNLVRLMDSISEDSFSLDNPPISLDDCYQNLKHSNIDYIVTEGAIKQGAANINSKKAYYDPNYKLITMDVSMHDSGIQLDAEHEADEATLSIMTLVVNSLCARGYMLDESSEVYLAMKALTEYGLKDHLEGLKQLLDVPNGSKETLLDAVADTVIKGLMKLRGREGNLVQAVAENLVQAAREGTRITGAKLAEKIPFSHPAMFRQLISILSSALNKQGVRIKFPGLLAVLNPSNGIFKLYGDKLKRDYCRDKNGKNLTTIEAILEELKEYDKKPITSASLMRLGHNYKLIYKNGREEFIEMATPLQYWRQKEHIQDAIESGKAILVEDIVHMIDGRPQGRDLATYQVNFTGTDGNNYNIWDLDIVKHLYKYEALLDLINKGINTKTNTISESFKNDKLKDWIVSNIDDNGIALSCLNQDGTINLINLLNLQILPWVNRVLVEQGLQEITAINNPTQLLTVKKLLRRALQTNLQGLGTGKSNDVIINGKTITVSSKEIFPYELIMPKIYATKFGIEVGDSLSDIMKLEDKYFYAKSIKNWKSRISDDKYFDLELKSFNGNQILIIDKNNLTDERLASIRSRFKTKVTPNLQWDGNKLWRMDQGGDSRKYRMNSTEDAIYKDNYGNEIIITDNARFYVETMDYDSIRISDALTDFSNGNNLGTTHDLLKILADVNNDETNEYLDVLGVDPDNIDAAIQLGQLEQLVEAIKKFNLFNRMDGNELDKQKELPKVIQNLQKVAKRKFISFKESLNILAARIPAQSMQSFMTMKVVAFEDSGVNDAYVNYWQIWLQGSDFDIDKVSLLGHGFTENGLFAKWSPYFKMETDEQMEASKNLPFPSGVKLDEKNLIKVTNPDNVNLDLWNKVIVPTRNIFDGKGKIKKNLEAADIEYIGTLLRILKEHTDSGDLNLYIPEDASKHNIYKFREFIKLANKHNTYLLKVHDQKDIITNFITTYMIKVSLDPSNLILAHSSVDAMTAGITEAGENSAKSKKTDSYAPGNAYNKMETLILTLTGKENVGIVASAMKTFEALSFYFNKKIKRIIKQSTAEGASLDKATLEASLVLMHDLHICGKSPKLIANTYTDEDIEELAKHSNVELENLKQALQEVDNDTDAFLLISALLSLATDNAKDPVLVKINANPEMISLYTAGVVMGIPFDTLTDTMMSRTGDVINSLLNGNVFLHQDNRKLADVLRYLEKGPLIYARNTKVLELLAASIKVYKEAYGKGTLSLNDLEILELQESDKVIKLNDAEKDASYIASQLRDIIKKDGSKGLIKVISIASEGSIAKSPLAEVKKLRDEMKHIESDELSDEEREKLLADKPLEDVLEEYHTSIEELKQKISKNETKTTYTELRILQTLLDDWLDYSYAISIAETEYIDEQGRTVKVTDKERNIKTRPSQCNKIGQCYAVEVGGLLHAYTLTEYEVPTEAIELYKKDNQDWLGNKDSKAEEDRKVKGDTYYKVKNDFENVYKTANEAHLKDPKNKKKKPLKKFRLWDYLLKLLIKKEQLGTLTKEQLDPIEESYISLELKDRIYNLAINQPVYPQGGKKFEYVGIIHNPYTSIIQLDKVNSEMGLLRDILSLNQGLPNGTTEILNKVRKLATILQLEVDSAKKKGYEYVDLDGNVVIYKTKKKLREAIITELGDIQLDLHKFLNDKEYQTKAINFMHAVKFCFNVLEAALEVPHYTGYLKALDALNESSKAVALAYRSATKLGNKVLDVYKYKNPKKVEEVFSQTYKFILHKINNLFLGLFNRKYIIPTGTPYFDVNFNEHIANGPIQLHLGTEAGNASFVKWFETVVIPNMQTGNFGKYGVALEYCPDFIKDLIPMETDRTVTGNATIKYTLPISMLPRSESEKVRYNKYKEDFNKMKSKFYYVQMVDPDTGQLLEIGYPVQELFFIYNIIAYDSESNQNAFTSIFEDMLRDGSLAILEEYNNFFGLFDKNSDIAENIDYTDYELLLQCAPILTNLEKATEPYGKWYDPDKMRYVLVKKKKKPVKQAITDPNAVQDDPGVDEGALPTEDEIIDQTGLMIRPNELELSDYELIPEELVREPRWAPKIPAIIHPESNTNSGTVRVKGNISVNYEISKENKVLVSSIQYNGVSYNNEELFNAIRSSKHYASLDKLDLEIPIRFEDVGGTVQAIADTNYLDSFVQEIFNPCD